MARCSNIVSPSDKRCFTCSSIRSFVVDLSCDVVSFTTLLVKRANSLSTSSAAACKMTMSWLGHTAKLEFWRAESDMPWGNREHPGRLSCHVVSCTATCAVHAPFLCLPAQMLPVRQTRPIVTLAALHFVGPEHSLGQSRPRMLYPHPSVRVSERSRLQMRMLTLYTYALVRKENAVSMSPMSPKTIYQVRLSQNEGRYQGMASAPGPCQI